MSSTAARACVDLAVVVEFVGVAKLMLRDPDAEFGAVFGTRAFEARFEFGLRFRPWQRWQAEASARRSIVEGKSAHGGQRFFGSIAIRRWVACHS